MDSGYAKTLYEQYGYLIYGRCIRILRSPEDASDAMQEVFLKLLQRWESVQNKEGVVSWIYSVATNHCFNLLRRRKRHTQEIPGDEVAGRRDTEAEFQTMQLIRCVLDIKNPKVREAVYYTYIEELDQESIYKLTGQSPATIRRNLQRLKALLPGMRKKLDLE
jgi:RNA polymerase sigma-70 factor (ECF subfamily)